MQWLGNGSSQFLSKAPRKRKLLSAKKGIFRASGYYRDAVRPQDPAPVATCKRCLPSAERKPDPHLTIGFRCLGLAHHRSEATGKQSSKYSRDLRQAPKKPHRLLSLAAFLRQERYAASRPHR